MSACLLYGDLDDYLKASINREYTCYIKLEIKKRNHNL